MSDRDDTAADTRENIERDIQRIIDLRTQENLTGKEIAARMKWPVTKTQIILSRLVKHNVVNPAGARRGSRQRYLDFIDDKYGKRQGAKTR